MTRIFDKDSGSEIPITVIEIGPNVVQQVKTDDQDGYNAVQLGYGIVEDKRLTKPEAGHCRKHGGVSTRMIREFKLAEGSDTVTAGKKIGVEMFEGVGTVNVVGTTKGRGFSGTIRRHGFHRGRETHGNTNHREGGSIGESSYPSRVFPGIKMAGQYGNVRRTAKNLKVVGIDKDAGVMLIRGAVPGPNRGIVFVMKNAG